MTVILTIDRGDEICRDVQAFFARLGDERMPPLWKQANARCECFQWRGTGASEWIACDGSSPGEER